MFEAFFVFILTKKYSNGSFAQLKSNQEQHSVKLILEESDKNETRCRVMEGNSITLLPLKQQEMKS